MEKSNQPLLSKMAKRQQWNWLGHGQRIERGRIPKQGQQWRETAEGRTMREGQPYEDIFHEKQGFLINVTLLFTPSYLDYCS